MCWIVKAPIKVPSSSVYNDPEKDNAEESLEVVQNFFKHDAESNYTRITKEQRDKQKVRELDPIYQGRQKEVTSSSSEINNW